MIPAFTSLLINYDPRVVNYKSLTKRLQKLLKLDVNEEASASRVFEIPVCYGGEYGPDIENIAKHAGLTEEEVIEIHASKDYLIYMLGFLLDFLILVDWMRESIHQDLPIQESESQQEVSGSVVPRREFIHWIHREDGSSLE